MNLSDLNDLDFSDMGNWPMAAKVVAILFLCAGLLGLGYYLDTQAQLEQLEKAQQQEQQLKNTLKSKAAKAVNLDAYKRQMEEMKQSFGAMLKQLPNKAEVAELLVDISQTGLATGLEFKLFKPENEVPLEFYAEKPIRLRVTGTYHEFGNFVSGVAALPRIVTLHDFSIKPTGNDAKILVMDATAKTYRYLDEEK